MADTLNLVNPNDALSCKYEISKFPDGQQSIRILEHNYNTYETFDVAEITCLEKLIEFIEREK